MYEFININKHSYSNKYQTIEMIVFSLAGFLVPLFLGHPQILVGVIVNTALILSAIHLKGYKSLPVIIMPSLGVLCRGLIFGPFTPYLVYMIPFIWFGNFLLVFSFKYFKINYWLKLSIGIFLKAGFLFSMALIFYKLGLLPLIFLTTMGILQVTTALLGGIAVFTYEKLFTTIK